ncbi:MAG: M48 family metalloprotease [Flavobacteriales bacterium]|nr:M48 family metalloprotease [Flavobacteriales bacterium]
MPPSYALRASFAVGAIVLFFVLYASLVAALGYLAYLSVIYPMGAVNKFTILMKIGAIAGGAMLFVFTLKFIFKLKNHVPQNRITLKRSEQPRLFEFVDRICQETSAPRPRRIHADPDVNAYVAYTNTWLSLFLPVRKDLTIGLGLVSILDRSEFKAVTAHEFGHFAQRSMRIGSYIHSANTIIHDMIHARDSWDRGLEQWRGQDIRLSAAAWVITPIIWVIRQVLGLFYLLLSRLHASLSREMEFNADKVAVSTSGSEAIISALWKLDDGERYWSSTVNNAYLAAQKGIFVRDLYHHDLLAIARGATEQVDRLMALPADARGGRRYFSTNAMSKVGMYSSHPPNDQREDSAKQPFIPCERDDRPAWTLFDDPEGLRAEMTALVYKQYLSHTPKEFMAPEDFEAFVSAESQGAELLAEHHNTFSERFLQVPDEAEMAQARAALRSDPRQRVMALREELATLMNPVREIDALMAKAQAIADGTTREQAFSFQGNTYSKKALNEGYQKLAEAKEKLFQEDFKAWDAAFCAAHLELAVASNEEAKLIRMYEQHKAITVVFRKLIGGRNWILARVQELQARKDVTKEEVRDLGNEVNKVVLDVNTAIHALSGLDMVPMPNIANGAELADAVFPKGRIEEGSIVMFENGDFNRLMNDLDRAVNHCQRLDQKSIACILAFHRELEEAVVEAR